VLKIKNILVSQPEPEGAKSPYFDIAKKYGVNIFFRPFIKVEGISLKEFLNQKIEISEYSAVVFVAKTGIDHFFRLAKENKVKISAELKYFCLNESFSYYIQKYVKYRKRKVFAPTTGKIKDLFNLLNTHIEEKFLIILPEKPNEEISELLVKSNLNHKEAFMYRSVSNNFTKTERFNYDMLIFFSPLGVHTMIKNFPKFKQGEVYIGCLGSAAAQAIRDAGFRVDLEVPNPQFSSITLAIEDFIKTNQKNLKK